MNVRYRVFLVLSLIAVAVFSSLGNVGAATEDDSSVAQVASSGGVSAMNRDDGGLETLPDAGLPVMGKGSGSDGATARVAGNEKKDIEGIWEGSLDVNGSKLRVVFHISRAEDGSLTATLDSPDQGATGIPVSKVTFEGGKLVVNVDVAMAMFEGQANGDLSSIDGNWKQRGMTFPLKLERVKEAPKMSRPQEPKKPYPYKEEEVTIENKVGGVELAGTLTIPKGKPPFPAVVLITGSGPEDRDETVFGHKPFLVLADYLTRRGVAVLRVDDRGVGGSSGDLWSSTSRDFAGDVEAEVRYLMGRKEIDAERIGLIGHSEGGIIAPMVAVDMKNIAFIVLMAGPGVPGDSILYHQSALIAKAEGASEEEIAKNRLLQEKAFAIVEGTTDDAAAREKLEALFAGEYGHLDKDQRSAAPDSARLIEAQTRRILNPWFRYFLTYDPAETLRKVKCPVLAIGGEKDLQVPADENLEAIREALKAGGNGDFIVKKLPGLNHLFQTAETGDVSEYSKIEETISPVALKLIGDWIVGHVSGD